jgi:hypothetical protein
MASKLMKVTVEMSDGSIDEYNILPITRVAFERKFGIGIGSMAEGGVHEEYIFWMAWDAIHRSGKVVKPFDDWLAEVAAVTSEDEAGPLGTTPSPTQ